VGTLKDTLKSVSDLANSVEIAQGEFTPLYYPKRDEWGSGVVRLTLPIRIPHPLDLPYRREQCAHVYEATFGDEVVYIRCKRDATTQSGEAYASNGWLCRDHNYQILYVKGRPIPYDVDARVVDRILKVEARALSGAPREGYGLKSKIQFVAGKKMSYSPDGYYVPQP
jgi:hypothetical protein